MELPKANYTVKFHRYDEDEERWKTIPFSIPTYEYDDSTDTLNINSETEDD